MPEHPNIPEIDPAVVRLKADNDHAGDATRVATTSLAGIEYCGAWLSSRYRKAHDYHLMLTMIDGVDANLQPMIESIYCDGDAVYSVILRPCKRSDAALIGSQMERESGGHNGLYIRGPNRLNIERAPFWDRPN